MNELPDEEKATLEDMPVGQWFYAIPARFFDLMESLESKGFVKKEACSFNTSGVKWKRVK